MKYLFYITIAAILMVTGCKKESLQIFDQENTGSSIYFQAPFLALNEGKEFSFGFSPASVKDTTFSLVIATTGLATATDRDFVLEVDPISGMVKGTHYDILSPALIIPAGKTSTKVSFKFYRASDLQAGAKFLNLKLIENENFNTKISHRVTTDKYKISLLDYFFITTDVLNAPYAWSVTPYKTSLDNYLGTYSKVKLQLLVNLFGVDPAVFTNEKFAKDNYFSIALLGYWGGYMKLWLAKEAAAGRIYKDENGVVITMGPRAS